MPGLAHLLGITVRATVRFSLDFVVRYVRYCVAEASSAKITRAAKDDEDECRMRLFWLYPALEAARAGSCLMTFSFHRQRHLVLGMVQIRYWASAAAAAGGLSYGAGGR